MFWATPHPSFPPDLFLYVNLGAKGAQKLFKTLAPQLTVLGAPSLQYWETQLTVLGPPAYSIAWHVLNIIFVSEICIISGKYAFMEANLH